MFSSETGPSASEVYLARDFVYHPLLVSRLWEALLDAPLAEVDRAWMEQALAEARRAGALGEVPIGAVIVRGGEVVGRGYNRRETDGDPLGHAEILAIHEASRQVEGWRLTECTLYVTLEPCAMCAGALVASRVDRLVFGASDPKAGYCGSLGNLVQDVRLNHRLEVVDGVMAEECGDLLRRFFARLRGKQVLYKP